jgi:phage shock protein PspC (stress-responsive transcriptional regulator)
MSTETKRLYRSQNDRMIGGVCAGLGEYLGIDPTIIRLLFAFTTIWGGAGALIYLVMLLVVPEEPQDATTPSGAEEPVALVESEEEEA